MIHTKNLTKVYQAGSQVVQALKGVNLNVNKGEFVSIMGRRGGPNLLIVVWRSPALRSQGR